MRLGRKGFVVDGSKLEDLLATRREKGSITGPLEFRRADGTTFPVEVTSILVPGPFGEELACTTFRDITERTRKDQALAVSEERLRNLIRSIPIPLAVNDRDRKIVSVNDKYTAVLGYTPEDVPDVATWFERAYPDPSYRRWVQDVWEAALREAEATGGEVAGRDYRVTAKDGSVHTMEISGVPVGDNFLVTLIEVTERDRAQAAVRESEERYRTLVESLHAGVVVHAPDTSIILSNATASELLGLSSEQMRGRAAIDPAWRFVRGDDTPMPLSEYPVNQAIATLCPVTNLTLGIDRPVTKDRVWVLVNAYPTFRSPGRLQQVVVTFVDITGEKRAEAERARLQAMLAQASRLAAMGTLVAGVAHEINNPLSAQLSGQGLTLELARDARTRRQAGTRLDLEDEIRLLDEVVGALEDAQEGGQRVARIVRDMAAFANPDSTRTRVGLAAVVDAAMRWLPAWAARSASIQVEDRGAPDIMASGGQIEQVVVNLVTNAAKASRPGEQGEILVRASAGSGGMARLEVTDHGTGIDPAILDRIFDPFFTTRRVGEGRGSGLGLAVCQAIAISHGGTLTVETKVGVGSTFRLELPAAPDAARSPTILLRMARREVRLGAHGSNPGGGPRVSGRPVKVPPCSTIQSTRSCTGTWAQAEGDGAVPRQARRPEPAPLQVRRARRSPGAADPRGGAQPRLRPVPLPGRRRGERGGLRAGAGGSDAGRPARRTLGGRRGRADGLPPPGLDGAPRPRQAALLRRRAGGRLRHAAAPHRHRLGRLGQDRPHPGEAQDAARPRALPHPLLLPGRERAVALLRPPLRQRRPGGGLPLAGGAGRDHPGPVGARGALAGLRGLVRAAPRRLQAAGAAPGLRGGDRGPHRRGRGGAAPRRGRVPGPGRPPVDLPRRGAADRLPGLRAVARPPARARALRRQRGRLGAAGPGRPSATTSW